MQKLAEVQEAKELMNEAVDWSVFTWMFEKPRVRKTADRANDALDRLERTVKARWSDELKAALRELSGRGGRHQKSQKPPQIADPRNKAAGGKSQGCGRRSTARKDGRRRNF